MDFAFLSRHLAALLAGVPLTLKLRPVSVVLGAVLALRLALMRAVGPRALRLARRAPMSSSSAARRCWCRSS